jgi:hypothetical protein
MVENLRRIPCNLPVGLNKSVLLSIPGQQHASDSRGKAQHRYPSKTHVKLMVVLVADRYMARYRSDWKNCIHHLPLPSQCGTNLRVVDEAQSDAVLPIG